MRSDVVDLSDKDPDRLGPQQHTCANPRCDEQFTRALGRGRPKDFHDEDCRRRAERDFRRFNTQLAHHERQAAQLRARTRAYLRTSVDDASGLTHATGPTETQLQAARDAVLEVGGMSRFLTSHEGEFAQDLLKLYRAVQPVIAATCEVRTG